MNVLFVLPWDQKRGGVTAVATNVASHLLGDGHNVWFLHPGAAEKPLAKTTQTGMPGFDMKLRDPVIPERPLRGAVGFWLFLPRTLWRLNKLLREHDIDVVNIHYPNTSFVYFALCRMVRRFTLVVSLHGADLMPAGKHPKKYSWALRLLLRRSDQVTAPSRNYLETILGKFPGLRPKAHYIHNGIDVAELQAKSSENVGDTPYTLTIAIHDEKKAIDTLVRAIPISRARGFDMKVALVGGGPLESKLKELASELGVADQVHFLGYCELEAVRALLQGCSFFVLPSRSEPFGIVILEAMAVGKAVVATRVGGIPEFVSDGENGILVEPDDPQALAEALCKVAGDPALRERLGKAGQATVAGGFTTEHMGRRFAALFATAASNGHRSAGGN